MTFGGVPVLDWLLLVVLLGFGVEAYVTTRPRKSRAAPPPPAAAATRSPPAERSSAPDIAPARPGGSENPGASDPGAP